MDENNFPSKRLHPVRTLLHLITRSNNKLFFTILFSEIVPSHFRFFSPFSRKNKSRDYSSPMTVLVTEITFIIDLLSKVLVFFTTFITITTTFHSFNLGPIFLKNRFHFCLSSIRYYTDTSKGAAEKSREPHTTNYERTRDAS